MPLFICIQQLMHSGHNATKGTSNDAGGLEPVIKMPE